MLRSILRVMSPLHASLYHATGGRGGVDLIMLGSNAGQTADPAWVLNLLAHPEAEVEIGCNQMRVASAVAEGPERQRLWELVVRDYPVFNSYQRKITRPIPVFRLRPTG